MDELRPAATMFKKLQVVFEGEDGKDDGGLTVDAFGQFFKCLYESEALGIGALFEVSSGGLVLPRPDEQLRSWTGSLSGAPGEPSVGRIPAPASSAALEVGESVYARFGRGTARGPAGPTLWDLTRWHQGVVRRINEDGTLAIDYSDGDREKHVPRELVRPSKSAANGGGGASSTEPPKAKR